MATAVRARAPVCTAPPRKNLFAPRPLRGTTLAGAILRSLEVECCLWDDGPCHPPGVARPRADDDEAWAALAAWKCPHCLAADHVVSLEGWAQALREYDRAGMDGPPLDPDGGDVLLEPELREARYYLRQRAGYAPHHPDDVLCDERISPVGTAGRKDVRALSEGLWLAGEEEVEEVEEVTHAGIVAELVEREATWARWRREREATPPPVPHVEEAA